MNIQIDIDKIGGKLTTDKNGKQIIVIPFKESYIETFARKDGSNGIRLNFQSTDLKEKRTSKNGLFEETGIIKQNIKKDVFGKLTDEQKDKIPICGQISEYIGGSKAEPEENILADDFELEQNEGQEDDLPF